MRKDLRAAFELAVEQHPIEHYKDVLAKFEEELAAQQQAFDEAQAAKKEAAATPKKSKKGKKAEDDDVDMGDVDSAKPKSKKRKAEDEASVRTRPCPSSEITTDYLLDPPAPRFREEA